MKWILGQLIVLLVLLPGYACNSENEKTKSAEATSARPVHWGYSEEDGPGKWASLSPVYALCGDGKSQSPIDIVNIGAKESTGWKLDYKNSSLRIIHTEQVDNIIDNGHTIQVNVDEGSTLTFEKKTYMLKQFHFHTPSEHTLDGRYAPMEMHFVHQAEDGSLAVMAVFLEEGKIPNENLAKIIANLPAVKGEEKYVKEVAVELNMHLPKQNNAYHYIGSLTTPPCSEEVQWLVLRDPVFLTSDQVKAFASRIGKNNRPTQPLHDRKIKATELAGKVH